MDVDAIAKWYRQERTPSMDVGDLHENYFRFHPRTAFLKTLPRSAVVADIGAGDGSLSVFRDWPAPQRSDLRLYAYSIEKGEKFDAFDGYEISDWNVAKPQFYGVAFDAVMCAHFIEHIEEPLSFVHWCAAKLRPGGRVYLEWPSDASQGLPPRESLQAAGVNVLISNFRDDRTHVHLPDRGVIIRAMQERGFEVIQQGIVSLPHLEEELMASLRDDADPFGRQAAFWLHTGWCQYIVARVPGHGDAG